MVKVPTCGHKVQTNAFIREQENVTGCTSIVTTKRRSLKACRGFDETSHSGGFTEQVTLKLLRALRDPFVTQVFVKPLRRFFHAIRFVLGLARHGVLNDFFTKSPRITPILCSI